MRLRLREVHDEDLPILFEFHREPAAVHMAAFVSRDPEDRAAFDAHWNRLRADERILLRVIEVDDELAGSVSSFPMEGDLEITYWIGESFWGRGIATAALKAFLQIQTERPLVARAAKDNHGSVRVLEKCGFRHQTDDRGFARARGQEIDEVVMLLE